LARSDYHPVKRGHYKLPQRLKTMQNIRELIIQGYTYNAIMQQLHIPHRIFYRLLSALFEDDRRLLSEVVTDDEKLNQMAIFRNRLLGDKVRMLQLVEDKSFQDRAAAQHLASEIAVVIMKIYTEGGPAFLSRNHAYPSTPLNAAGFARQYLKLCLI
jgi:hypothetical protein